MIRRDYLQKQIDQLGKALGKVLNDLTGLRNDGKISEGIEITDQSLKTQLDLNIDDIIAIPADGFLKSLGNEAKLNDDHLSYLADIMFIIAEGTSDMVKSKKLYERCLLIYEHLDKNSTTYSLERYFKIDQIKQSLQ